MWLTPAQARELLGISRATMYRWIETGAIAAHRIGPKLWRIDERDIHKMLGQKEENK